MTEGATKTLADAATPSAPAPTGGAKSMVRIGFEQLLEHRLAVVSFAIIVAFGLIAVLANVIAWALHLDPNNQDILNRYGPFSADHWLGTDEAGRDVLIRLVFGTRISLTVAFLTTLSATCIGVTIGALAGYFGGIIDTLLMRATDSLLALPTIPVLIIVASIDTQKIPLLSSFVEPENVSIVKMILVLMIFSWMTQARLVRGETLAIKEQEYILAARTSGMGSFAIILKELLPNVLSPVIVSVTLSVGSSILYEAALSFLGLGIQPPTPSWGNMLNNAQEIIYSAPWLAVIPGLLILTVVMAFNFLGDGLQDALDPKAIRR